MARKFTVSLQKKLQRMLPGMLPHDLRTRLSSEIEGTPLRAWEGHPDVWLQERTPDGTPVKGGLFVLELEHRSSTAQAETNLRQPARFAVRHRLRRISFLHLINDAGNVGPRCRGRLVEMGRAVGWLTEGSFRYELLTYTKRPRDTKTTPKVVMATLKDSTAFRAALERLVGHALRADG